MKKWVKASSLFVALFFFCTGIAFAGNFNQGPSTMIVSHNGNGAGNASGDAPGDGTGVGAPDGAGDCPSGN